MNPFRRIRAFPGVEYAIPFLVTAFFTLIFFPLRDEGGQDHTVISLLYLLLIVISSLLVHSTQDLLVLSVFLAANAERVVINPSFLPHLWDLANAERVEYNIYIYQLMKKLELE